MTAGEATQEAPREQPHKRPGIFFLITVAVAFAVLMTLGTWQVQRLHWKEDLLATIDARIAADPLPLSDVEAMWASDGDVEYVPMRVSGTFDHAGEQHFLATHEGQSGWYVYTPLELDDGRHLIVNRGFVPYDMKDQDARKWDEPSGEIGFSALARNPLEEKPGFVVPDNAPADNLWYWKHFSAMREAMALEEDRTLPFFADIRAYDEAEIAYPVANVTQVQLPNSHLQYAVTWYGLGAALAAVAGFMFFRKPKASENEVQA